MKFVKCFFTTTLIVFSLFYAFSAHADFSRTLKRGDSGDDVLLLQKILNRNTDTQITSSGLGSPGNETRYFGYMTYLGVIKFQKKYGLTADSIVGPKTIEKLLNSTRTISYNSNSGSNSIPFVLTPYMPSNNGYQPPTKQEQSTPVITSISSTVFGNDDTITITGKNFTNSNSVVFSNDFPNKFTKINSKDGTTLTLKPTFTISERLQSNISGYSTKIQEGIIKKITDSKSADSQYKDGWYVPAKVTVVNENGTSNEIVVTINVLKNI